MLLRWKKDNLKVIHLIPTTKDAKKIELKKTTITLLPGINEISENAYTIAKPHIKDNLADGSLEEIKGVTTLPDVEPKLAAEFISQTNNPETLYLWIRIESRDSLRNQIRDRIKELNLSENPPVGIIVEYPEEETPAKNKSKEDERPLPKDNGDGNRDKE